MAEIRRIPRQRVADEVYAIIRQAILAHEFVPGERLEIPTLAQRLDVSQMPVRQAIHKLSNAGLVEIRPRSGTFVAKLTPDDVVNTFSIRRALECLAAEDAIDRVEEHDLKNLRDLASEIEALPRQASVRERALGAQRRFSPDDHQLG